MPEVEARAGRLAGWRRYAFDTLSLNGQAPPWHRGILALYGVLAAVVVGREASWREAAAIAPAMAVFLTLADVEGTLSRRLFMLVLTAAGLLAGGAVVILTSAMLSISGALMLILVALAGMAAVIGPPYQQAGRFMVVAGLLLTVTAPVSLDAFGLLLAEVVGLLAVGRSVEHVLAPDARQGSFATLKHAAFTLRAERAHWPRFVVSYVASAALGYAAGRSVDAVHPTWLTVTVVVVMWPDAQRSYQRILQRVFGTLVGAVVVIALIALVPEPRLLAVVVAAMLYFLPIFIRRNYWLHTGLMVVFVLLSLRLFQGPSFSLQVVLERIGDVLAGCAFALLGTFAAFSALHARIKRRSRTGGAPVL